MTARLRSSIIGTLVFAALPLLVGSGQVHGITLVEDGRSDYTIVISPESSPPQRYAAEELATFVEQMSGAKLPVAVAATEGPMVTRHGSMPPPTATSYDGVRVACRSCLAEVKWEVSEERK